MFAGLLQSLTQYKQVEYVENIARQFNITSLNLTYVSGLLSNQNLSIVQIT